MQTICPINFCANYFQLRASLLWQFTYAQMPEASYFLGHWKIGQPWKMCYSTKLVWKLWNYKIKKRAAQTGLSSFHCLSPAVFQSCHGVYCRLTNSKRNTSALWISHSGLWSEMTCKPLLFCWHDATVRSVSLKHKKHIQECKRFVITNMHQRLYHQLNV